MKTLNLLMIASALACPASVQAGAFVPPHPDRFTLFESGPVRPLALSADGKYLYAANTPDGRLEIFRVYNNPAAPLVSVASAQVGLEPVAVAVRGDRVWVVNHLSDSVSVVDVKNPHRPRVVQTLLVGDEPRDIVFAGPGRGRAFLTTAHRGQNHPQDPELSTPGVGRADVWVFDAENPGDDPGGTPLTIVNLFADTPRALAVSPDGATVYAVAGIDGPPIRCVTCHAFDPDGNAEFGVERPGFFGTDGRLVVEGDDFLTPENGTDLQPMKVPHFRNLYQKVGMFGTPDLPNSVPFDDTHKGDQIRGFGYLHDGSTDRIFRFMQVVAFTQILAPNGFPVGPEGHALARDVEAFLLAFDSNLAPIVGQQVTLDEESSAAVSARIDLLVQRAAVDECELVVTTRQQGFERGYLYLAAEGKFQVSEAARPRLTDAQLRALADKAPLTYTCLPVGSGYRVALDADRDGCFNVDEAKAGTDPRDRGSLPPGC